MLGYFGLLAMASLIWSAQGTAVKFLDRHMGPIAITFVPFYITTLLFVPMLIQAARQSRGAAAHMVGLGQVHARRCARSGAGAARHDLGYFAVAGFERRRSQSDDSGDHGCSGFYHAA